MEEGGKRRGLTVLAVLHGRFPALRSRDFRLLWFGQAISAIGSQMQFGAIYWHIYALTHQSLALGLIGLVRVVPVVFFSLVGGSVADAVDRRRVMLVTQSIQTLAAGALALLTHTGHISAAAIYGINFLSASAIAFDNPARQSLMPNLVPRDHFANAASLNSIAMQTATILGPTLAGLLIAHGDLEITYLVNSVSFLAVIAALLLMSQRASATHTERGGEVSLTAIREGLRFVRHTPILVWTITLDFLATFFSSATALLPVFAATILHSGARGYGLLYAADAVGSLCAGSVIAMLPPIRWQGRTILVAVFIYGSATVLFGFSHMFWLSWLALALSGAADTVSTILRQTIRQLVTPDHLRGRMSAAMMIFFMGGPQLGNLEAGVVAKWIGAPWSVISGGIGCLLASAVVALRARALREYRASDGQTTE